MNTLQSINTRKWLLLPVFAAFAAYAQASQAADGSGDTQSQVRAVLEGARSHIDSSRPATLGAPSAVADIQENTRQLLLGTTNSNAGVRFPTARPLRLRAPGRPPATGTAMKMYTDKHSG